MAKIEAKIGASRAQISNPEPKLWPLWGLDWFSGAKMRGYGAKNWGSGVKIAGS